MRTGKRGKKLTTNSLQPTTKSCKLFVVGYKLKIGMPKQEPQKMKDHRDIGQALDLFSFHDISPGAPFWHSNGMIIIKELEKYLREQLDIAGYEEISTPILVKKEVFEKSGHWKYYRDLMFYFENPRDEKEVLVIKPMNCPESTYIYNSKIRSYKNLPLRLAEIGLLHRNEPSGTIGGLFRVRQLTMDDAHIYALPNQIKEEMIDIIRMIEKFYNLFEFEPRFVLATKPEKALGSDKDWQLAEESLAHALKTSGKKFAIAKGEGAFYGPKIEVHLKDSQGRDWQMGTAQLDLVMLPKQFNTFYIAEDGSKKLPWVIHRAIFGSFERFIGILLEHTQGKLPLWLSPTQVEILSITNKQEKYAQQIFQKFLKENIRAKLNAGNETVSKKIREAELQKIPYILVVGEKEMKNRTVNVRHYRRDQLGEIKTEKLIWQIRKEIDNKII